MISVRIMPVGLKPKCEKKSRVFGGENRLPQPLGNVVVVKDDAPLDGELADELIVAAQHARDGVRRVVVERADGGQVVGIGEEHAAQGAEERRGHKERDDAGVTREAKETFIRSNAKS